MKKVTIQSPSNIAFIKYWGRRDDELVLPLNGSISMNLSDCFTQTTVEFGDFSEDEVKLDFQTGEFVEVTGSQRERVQKQLDRIRSTYKISQKAKIWSRNNFPTGAGIASSASGFSALTASLFAAAEIEIDEASLTIETRRAGSGSACRSIPDGFVEWYKGIDSESSYAESIALPNHWDLRDLVVVVDDTHKKVGSMQGHSGATGNEYMEARLVNIDQRLNLVRNAIREKNIQLLGEVIENDAISLHAVAMLSNPPIFYLNDRTFAIISLLHEIREQGTYGYFTMDAGPNVHIICESSQVSEIKAALNSISGIKTIIENSPAKGAHQIETHLF